MPNMYKTFILLGKEENDYICQIQAMPKVFTISYKVNFGKFKSCNSSGDLCGAKIRVAVGCSPSTPAPYSGSANDLIFSGH